MLNVVVAALALVPQPQKLLETGGVSPATNVVYETDRGIAAEGYRLAVTKDRIVIASSDDAGAFYARQTLRQLGEPTPCVEIEDAPAYSWRGGLYYDGGLSDPIPFKKAFENLNVEELQTSTAMVTWTRMIYRL